mgnify:FL=1|jgi:energy-coupling factor transporter ATP-binding protein EcfA2
MATITKIEIDGFKAFPNNFSIDLPDGKNLLIYGENGSGKSSLYYALHVLMQSVFKDDKGVKYFKPGDTNGGEFIPNNEQLININRFDEAKANTYTPNIRITFDDGKVWRLDNGGLQSENGGSESDIRMLNKDSAFINHSYISRFHAARNSEEINLWNVFYKDILPFHLPAGTSEFLADLYDNIKREYNGGVDIKNKAFQNQITKFNDLLNKYIDRINIRINSIYNDNFKNEGDKDLNIKLTYYSKDHPDNVLKEQYYLFCEKNTNGTNMFYPPKIGIEIKEAGLLIYKPQSYFNEAKLTAIALAVRFAAMSTTTITPGSFLALDDMLISLDMSNRMKVIKYLLDVVAFKYKLYVFTHDRLFYHTLKRIIETQYKSSEWLFGGIYVDDSITPNEPNYVPDDKTKIEKIEDAYKCHDYFLCGTLLRQECERCLKELLPDSYRVKEDPRTRISNSKNLDEQIASLEEFCRLENIDYTPFKDLKSYKDLFLNSTAHNDITSPFYRNEVKICKQAITLLAQINRTKTIKCKQDFCFEYQSPNGKNCLVSMRRREPIRLLEYNGQQRISYYSKCEIRKIVVDGTDTVLNEGFNSIYQAYFYVCQNYNCPSNLVLLDILKDRDGYLKDKI